MRTNLGAWTFVYWIIRSTALANAMKWDNEEQFVDGELPYYPFNNKIIYSLGNGLSGDEALVNEFSPGNTDKNVGSRGGSEFLFNRKRSFPDRAQKATFYEFKNDSNTMIDASKRDEIEKPSKTGESVKSLNKIGRLVLKNNFGESKKTKTRGGVSKGLRSNLKKRESDSEKEDRIGFDKQKSRFMRDELNPRPIFENGLIQNFSGIATPEGKPNGVRSYGDFENLNVNRSGENRNVRPNQAPKINGPYENNFSGGGFRHMNPSTWLAREIEKFIRRQDYRWLDFMKNNGLETNSLIVETTRHLDATKSPQKVRLVDSLQQDEEGVIAEPKKEDSRHSQKALLHQIDALLEDLSQFRASVKHKKARNVRLSDRDGKLRETRSVTLPSFRGKSELPKSVRSALSSSLVLDDLRDLKRNIVLYENSVGDEENRQALKDLKLHIKVYVENGGNGSNEEK
ncbi:hypothetical protein GE061_013175 [Apolygus lucorum]|uniref:Uncharacterized protein n=1 Tax=Apolygus lucorum TaxID=248454 RepID=A0A8S9XVR8_APOLU|nr:hypothetical protein GE061_013175 [Apolygus lucorum]